MLTSDPPDHARLRTLVNKAFTVRTVTALRPRIEEITDALLDAADQPGEIDLIAALAFPLPVAVICELLGVPYADRSDFSTWSNVITSSTSDADALTSASGEMARYLLGLIALKRSAPADDLLSRLIAASDEGDRLSETELVSMGFLLLVAGHETTVNLIGNGVLSLLRHPDQLAALRADPGLVEGAIEEFLRFDGPVNIATFRFAGAPLTIGGQDIAPGEIVFVALGSADRDAERFPEPDRLDVSRTVRGHLAFGNGIHYCVGAPLARLEGQIAIGRLLARYPDLALATDPDQIEWRESSLIRGVRAMPVRLR